MKDVHDIDEDISYFWIIIVLSVAISVFYILFAIVFWNGICSLRTFSCYSCNAWNIFLSCFKICRKQFELPVSSEKHATSNNLCFDSPVSRTLPTTNVSNITSSSMTIEVKNPKLKKGVSRKEYFK